LLAAGSLHEAGRFVTYFTGDHRFKQVTYLNALNYHGDAFGFSPLMVTHKSRNDRVRVRLRPPPVKAGEPGAVIRQSPIRLVPDSPAKLHPINNC